MTKDDAIKAIEETRSFWEAEAAKAFSAKKPQVYAVAMHTERQFKKLIDAFHALPDAGWRDIESAPKDAMILAHADGMIRLVMWEGGRWVQVGATIEHGWFEPLHWMHLPQPPEKA